MKKTVPGMSSESPAASPMPQRTGLGGPLTRSTPKASQLSMGAASLGSSLSHSDEEFLVESETLQLTTPRNLTTTFSSQPAKSALKKSVRIVE